MSHFYEIQTYSAKAAKLKMHGEEAELLFLTYDDEHVSVILPQSALRALAQQVAEQLPAE